MAKKNRYNDFDDSQVKMPELKELLSGNVKTTDVVPKKQVVEQAKEKETIKAKSVPKKKKITIAFFVSKFAYFELLSLKNEISFLNNVKRKNISVTYIIEVALHNMEIEYLKKYQKVESPNEQYRSFYSQHSSSLSVLPSLISHYKEEKKYVYCQLSIETRELLYRLMHCYYINEVQEQHPHVKYGLSTFFYEIIAFLRKNVGNLNMI